MMLKDGQAAVFRCVQKCHIILRNNKVMQLYCDICYIL